jgi:LPXTG-site transpeptidase (sortase) family protein
MKHPILLRDRIRSKRTIGLACIFFLTSPLAALAASPDQSTPLVAVEAAAAPALDVAAGPNVGSRSQPRRISIPSISVDAEIVPVGLDPKTKSLVVPKKGSIVGWFSRGAKQRPTVLVGHVDSAKKAAVFYRLPKLRTGDSIRVTNTDSTTRRYRVDRITRVDKDKFPTKSVYLGSGLRLITCGGKFDRKTGHYEDNVIVFATAF